jgi:hypothetical protein
LHPFPSEEPHTEVRFHFMPDKMRVDPDRKTTLQDSNAHTYPGNSREVIDNHHDHQQKGHD